MDLLQTERRREMERSCQDNRHLWKEIGQSNWLISICRSRTVTRKIECQESQRKGSFEQR